MLGDRVVIGIVELQMLGVIRAKAGAASYACIYVLSTGLEGMSIVRAWRQHGPAPLSPCPCCGQEDSASHGSMSETDGSVNSGSGSGATSGWVTDDMDETDDDAEGMADAVGGVVLWRFRLPMPLTAARLQGVCNTVEQQAVYQVQSLGTEGHAHVSSPEERAGMHGAPPASATAAAGDASQPDEPVSVRMWNEGNYSMA